MLTHNVFVIGFSYPVEGKARIDAHTTEQIDQCIYKSWKTIWCYLKNTFVRFMYEMRSA